MKVLWITFKLFPEVSELIGEANSLRGSGGWLFGAAEALLDNEPNIELRVASVSPVIKEFKSVRGERVIYYLIPYGKGVNKYHHGYDEYWKLISDDYQPDIVHIHGIESSLALSYIKVCGNRNVVCSIQGLFNIIARYMLHGIPYMELIRNTTIRDLIKGNSFHLQRQTSKRTSYIVETMKLGRYFIGRTAWDRAHLWAINPNAEYLMCNETLRSVFYEGEWQYCNCKRHSIFLSSPKGLPLFINALSLVANHYPDVTVRVAGSGNLSRTTWKKYLYRTSSEKLIEKRLSKLHLKDKISFLGPLSADNMRKEYLSANVFVNPSQIENSSNSVGEAQLLGVPTIASYVGGMADLIPDEESGIMYRFEEYEMLAKDICDIFENSPIFNNKRMRELAQLRHNRVKNASRTRAIYEYVVKQSNLSK